MIKIIDFLSIDKSFMDLLKICAEKYGDIIAVDSNNTKYRFNELYQKSVAFAGVLKRHGIIPGEHIALWSFNCAEMIVAFFGIIGAGCVATLMNYGASYDDLVKLMVNSDVKHIIYGKNREIMLKPGCEKRLADDIGIDQSSALNLYELISECVNPDENDIFVEKDNSRNAIIIFTTGTTSFPKSVLLSQKSVISDALGSINILNPIIGEKICVALPLFHSYGLISFFSYFLCGNSVFLLTSLKPEDILKTVVSNKITNISSVGAVYLSLLNHPDFKDQMAPLLHSCIVGGGFTVPVQMMRLDMAFPNAKFLCGYGQTESSPVITLVSATDSIEKRAYTVGKPIAGIDVEILGSDGSILPQGKTGEVVVKGPILMNGYYKLPKEKQAIDEKGWLRTGDLGFFDEEGYLHLSGRIKDIIIRGGENISPSDVENEIQKLDFVREVKVIGAPHPLFGESVEACIVPNGEFDEEKARAFLKSNIAPFKVPTHFLIYDKFPLNENGKLDMRCLRENMLDRLKLIETQEILKSGVIIAAVDIKNSEYNVVPVASMAESLALSLGFTENKASKIRLAAEEFLLERISNTYDDVGNIKMEIVMYRDYVSLHFYDNGKQYIIDKNSPSSYNAKIILKCSDQFRTEYTNEGKPLYCIDFIYDEGFNSEDFIMKYRREEKTIISNNA